MIRSMRSADPRLLIAFIATVVGACGSPGATPTLAPAATPAPTVAATAAATGAPTPDLDHPVGLVAIGHSGLTGEGTTIAGGPNPAASWATGDDPVVNSVYLRLVAAEPETAGNVSNQARGGARASALRSQAAAALATVPVPLLAIIQTVDNDLRCNASNVAQVGLDLQAALEFLHSASPNTRILVVGQLGRPTVDFITELAAHSAAAKASVQWADACSPIDADGNVSPSGIANLVAAIDAYEAETARVCALVPNCYTDGGVRRAWEDTIDQFASDFSHMRIGGQAREAEEIWPVVEQLLGL